MLDHHARAALSRHWASRRSRRGIPAVGSTRTSPIPFVSTRKLGSVVIDRFRATSPSAETRPSSPEPQSRRPNRTCHRSVQQTPEGGRVRLNLSAFTATMTLDLDVVIAPIPAWHSSPELRRFSIEITVFAACGPAKLLANRRRVGVDVRRTTQGKGRGSGACRGGGAFGSRGLRWIVDVQHHERARIAFGVGGYERHQ